MLNGRTRARLNQLVFDVRRKNTENSITDSVSKRQTFMLGLLYHFKCIKDFV